MVGHAAVEGRQADDAGQAEAVARAVDADAMAVELMAQELGDPGRCVSRLEREDAPAVMIEREADIAPRHRQALHGVEAGGIFGARRAQEFPAGRNLVEQPFDADSGPRGERRRLLPYKLAVVDLDSPAIRISDTALEPQAGHAGDRRQRLATETEAGHPVDRVLGQLRGGM